MAKPWEQLVREFIEPRYLAGKTPWEQSGFFGTEERWERLRRPIAQAVTQSGSFLDIGCANGYLIECLQKWTAERGLTLDACGVDILDSLILLAKQRLPALNWYAGNAMNWEPPRRFDYVRTELIYAPPDRQEEYLARLFYDFLEPGGKLIVTDYRRRDTLTEIPWADTIVQSWGFPTSTVISGHDLDGWELTRVVVVPRDGKANPVQL